MLEIKLRLRQIVRVEIRVLFNCVTMRNYLTGDNSASDEAASPQAKEPEQSNMYSLASQYMMT